jgi:acetyltransferase-like isoleucine patch superfamily enzyme
MISVSRIRQFIDKYRFPIHLVVLRDILVRKASVCFWTSWSRLIFALHGCRVAQGLKVDGRLIIRTALKGGITIGRNFKVDTRRLSNLVGLKGSSILCCYGNGRIAIGDNSGMSAAVLSSRSEIRIGNHVMLGGNVRIFDHDFHSLDPTDRRDPDRDKLNCRTAPVVIGDDVLVGADAIILKGVRIGARSVIGAGAVVTLPDIPSDSIIAGNPARVVRSAPLGFKGSAEE